MEENTALCVLGLLLIGFLAGLSTYKSILEIARLDVVPRHGSSGKAQNSPRMHTAKTFPRTDGLIADFKTGGGGPPRNAFNEVFNLLTDNEWNGTSKCWYQLKEETKNGSYNGNKYLRFFYQLEPREIPGGESYVGLFTDFSPPPPNVFDISQFEGVSFRLRLDQPTDPDGFAISISLASTNNSAIPGYYDYPGKAIEPYFISKAFPDWVDVSIPFKDFCAPPFSSRNVTLDTTQVFRLIISIVKSTKNTIFGHIDIDDLRFYRPASKS